VVKRPARAPDEEGEEAGGDVVQHDAGALGEGFERRMGQGLKISKRRKRRSASAACFQSGA
jgi:hypothetical protein